MSDIAKGTLVHHPSLGVGKVVAVEPTAVHVFFPGAERRFAAKLRWDAARLLLRTDGVEPDAWLEGLSSFTLDPAEGRYALAASWMTHEQAIAQFTRDHPRGFEGSDAPVTASTPRGARAPRWRAAAEAWTDALGAGQGERLLAAGEVRELVNRAVRLEKHVAPIAGALEAGTLKRALGDRDAAAAFFAALFDALDAAPGRVRMEKLFAAARALDVEPAAQWPVSTFLPFVADPARHVFLSPRTASVAAERLGRDLRYDAAPNWTTYAALRTLSTQLLAELAPLGARDFVDVETFLHATATSRPSGGSKPGRSKRGAPKPSTTGSAR